MGNYTDPPRDRGAHGFHAEQVGTTWRVIDPMGVMMGPEYTEDGAHEAARRLRALTTEVDTRWKAQVDAGKIPEQYHNQFHKNKETEMTKQKTIDLEALGLSQDELQQRVVDKLCDGLMLQERWDEDGDSWMGRSRLAKELENKVAAAIDAAVTRQFEEHIHPHVIEIVEGITLTKTNQWGEKKGETLTFVEYMVERVDAYIQEKVAFDGSKPDSYHRGGKQTRITYLVDSHLHRSIERATEKALKDMNSKVAQGITETVKLKLGECLDGLKIKAEVKT